MIGMLEKRVGEEAFKKLVERTVSAACESGSKGIQRCTTQNSDLCFLTGGCQAVSNLALGTPAHL